MEGQAMSYPPRFLLQGIVLNVFQAPKGESEDEKKRWGGDYRLQLMSADHLRNGETKLIPTDVSVGDEVSEFERYKKMMGKQVSLPVTVFVFNGKMIVKLASKEAAA